MEKMENQITQKANDNWRWFQRETISKPTENRNNAEMVSYYKTWLQKSTKTPCQ